jgi:hypothetical protein
VAAGGAIAEEMQWRVGLVGSGGVGGGGGVDGGVVGGRWRRVVGCWQSGGGWRNVEVAGFLMVVGEREKKRERRVQIRTTGVRLKNGRVIRASLEILAYLQYQSVH